MLGFLIWRISFINEFFILVVLFEGGHVLFTCVFLGEMV